MQEAQVWSLVQEDPMCNGATKPVGHNYWACALEPGSRVYRVLSPHVLEPVRIETREQPQLAVIREKPERSSEDPAQPSKRTKNSPWLNCFTLRQNVALALCCCVRTTPKLGSVSLTHRTWGNGAGGSCPRWHLSVPLSSLSLSPFLPLSLPLSLTHTASRISPHPLDHHSPTVSGQSDFWHVGQGLQEFQGPCSPRPGLRSWLGILCHIL